MKVIRINLTSLHNEEWFGFHTDFKEQIAKFGAENLKIKILYNRFILFYDKADKLLVVLRKSVHTREMEDDDRERDDRFRGFFGTVKGLQHQPDATKQVAALRMFNLLSRYKKSVLGGNYTAESAAIYNLLQDLRGEYAADITLLSLNDWVTAIDNAEKKFLASRSQRIAESANKPKEDLRGIRLQMDTLYKGIINAFDVQLLADGLGEEIVFDADDSDDEVTEYGSDTAPHVQENAVYGFVTTWNEIVKKYRNLLAQRAGRRAKAKETDETES
jgi:hypothetical protein